MELVVTAGILLAVAIVATNGFHFGHSRSARAKVSAYIQDVDRVQQRMQFEIDSVMGAYRAYASKSKSPPSVAELKAAEQTFRRLSARVAALPAPAQAVRLSHLLVSLLSAEHSVAVEVTMLAQFTPAFHAVTAQSQLLSAQLSKALAAVAQPKPHLVRGTKAQIAKARAVFAAAAAQAADAQANVIDTYDAALALLQARLARIVVPPVMEPTYAAEVATLQATRRTGANLAAALRAPKRTNVAALSRNFSIASRTAGTIARQREAIAAVQAYNARVKRVGALEGAVATEFTRLSNTLK